MKLLMFDEERNNKIKSLFITSIFIVIIGLIGALIGYIYGSLTFGLIMALIFSFIYSIIMYFAGASMILGMSGAKEVTKKENAFLVNTVEGVAVAAGLPTPKVYIVEDSAMNAFATGRDPAHASITVTRGLLDNLNRQEIEGVIGHEMTHVKNYDIRLMMITAVLVGVVTLLSDFLLRSFLWGGKGNDRNDSGSLGIILIVVGIVLAILTPLIAQLMNLAISRKREYAADAGGAILTRYPQGLADALKKISKDPDPLVDTANKATAHLYISTPFRKDSGWFVNMFSTHPPIKERIKRLESM